MSGGVSDGVEEGTRLRVWERFQSDPQAQVRFLSMLLVALSVAAVDQCVKVAVTTPSWAYHHRSASWFFGSCVLCLVVPTLAVVPSRAVLVGAALLSGGVLGNLLSAGADGLEVPNPLLVGRTTGVAFNVADVSIILGNLTLMVALATFAITNRDRIDAWNASVRRMIRVRF
jgi:lipoprotein signal peptidase